MAKTQKLYCFQYDIKENAVFREEYDAREYDTSYMITVGESPNDYDLFIEKHDVVNETAKREATDEYEIIYMYSQTDDVNHALDNMEKAIANSIKHLQKVIAKRLSDFEIFKAKKAEIKEKYPTGTTERKSD